MKDTSILTNRVPYIRENNYVWFGSYPQSEVKDQTLISSLLRSVRNLPTPSNPYNWTSYNYIISNRIVDFMWYIDVERNGEKYRGVYFTQYRPECTSFPSFYDCSQYKNGYKADYVEPFSVGSKKAVYWFKWEPIKWRVAKEDGGILLVSDTVLDSQPFSIHYRTDLRTVHNNGSPANTYENNYEYSYIRNWLNADFYANAFDSNQKGYIQSAYCDNSEKSTGKSTNKYACMDTTDNVWLSSYADILDTSTKFLNMPTFPTDYARVQGFNWTYWLRSPCDSDSERVMATDSYGDMFFDYVAEKTTNGIVPNIRLTDGKSSLNKDVQIKVSHSQQPFAYKRVTESGAYSDKGTFILMGCYPQAEVEDIDILNALDKLAGSTQHSIDTRIWDTFDELKYYRDKCWYKDIELDGERYRGIYFREYKPDLADEYGTSDCFSHQMSLGHTKGNVYWYKWLPIKWRILNEADGLATLICDSIIDSNPFCSERSVFYSKINGKPAREYEPNNYNFCFARKWLNSTFINAVFSEDEQNILMPVAVREVTETDKICLPSLSDVLSSQYGFDMLYDEKDANRKYQASQYAWLQGARNNWMLRTPSKNDRFKMWEVKYDGTVSDSGFVNFNCGGIVPMITIKLT